MMTQENVVHVTFKVTIREERWSGARGESEVYMVLPLNLVEMLDPGDIFRLQVKGAMRDFRQSLDEQVRDRPETRPFVPDEE